MTPLPRVSIGVPVYNGERYLASCLESLLAQTFSDIEIIVCDNASTDGTADIAAAYVGRDERVRYHRNAANIGCPRNFTRVVELARAPFFRWASADDLSAPTFVERCMEVLVARPDIVQAYPRTMTIDERGNVTGVLLDDIHTVDTRPSERYISVTKRLGRCNAIYGVMRTDVMRKTALLDGYIGSDIPFQAELALYGGIWEVPEPLFFRRMHAAAQSAMSDVQRTRHYDPKASRRKTSSLWRHLFARTRGVLRAPIALSEKHRIARFLIRDAVMSRDGYAAELRLHARQWLSRTVTIACIAVASGVFGGCAHGPEPIERQGKAMESSEIGPGQRELLVQRRIFFGHQSVGANIIAGVRSLLASDTSLHLRVVHSAQPWSVEGPALIESEIGRNGDPTGKTVAFATAVAQGLDEPGSVALHKYCYIDMTPETDVDALFTQYRTAMGELTRKHPLVTFVHVTMPLATDDASPLKRFIKRALGRDMALVLNRKRNQFNDLLRTAYAGNAPVFDLASFESTHADGSRSYVHDGASVVYTLAPEYSYDGGHLTPEAERLIGAKFIEFLASLPAPSSAGAVVR